MTDQKLLEQDQTFESFDLDPRILRAIAQLNFTHPTLVQAKAIPLALAGKDILARARTGSGKTATYTIPLIQKLLLSKKDGHNEPGIRALILVPTRELAEQVTKHIKKLIVYAKDAVKVVNLAGHMSAQMQRPILAEKPDIIVSTPSKVVLHLEAKNMDLHESLETLVIDEADLVLSFGYDQDLRKILPYLPKIYQSFLMSATFNKDVEDMKQLVLRKPAVLQLQEEEDEASYLTQYAIKCNEFEKFLYAFVIIKLRLIQGKIILFVNDVDRCYKLKLFLEQFSIKSCVLNSALPFNSRFHIVEEFNRGIYDFLIASDESQLGGEVDSEDEDDSSSENEEENEKRKGDWKKSSSSDHAEDKEYGVSRGVDFQNVAAVINFDFPQSAKAYTHRIGRTARGGQKGIALSFVVLEDKINMEPDLVRLVGRSRDVSDDKIFKRVEKQQRLKGMELKPYMFDNKNIEGFKYRIQDALRAVSKAAIKEARIMEIKREIFNSEKLKANLEFLRHDKAVRPAQVKDHLKHIPSYLMPRVNIPGASGSSPQKRKIRQEDVPFHNDKKRRKGGFNKGGAGKVCHVNVDSVSSA
ncbi:P-loop containing nucleoside triphosphate hydrolase protein [Dichotomocladium elegans]|nr:P-loop containing nucleoside triphosphate hydrolase protein [Dichotomocladium elegans]